jgi:hypothetical protein
MVHFQNCFKWVAEIFELPSQGFKKGFEEGQHKNCFYFKGRENNGLSEKIAHYKANNNKFTHNIHIIQTQNRPISTFSSENPRFDLIPFLADPPTSAADDVDTLLLVPLPHAAVFSCYNDLFYVDL